MLPFTTLMSAEIQLISESRVHFVIVASFSAGGPSSSGASKSPDSPKSSASSSSSNSSQPSPSSGPVVSYRDVTRSSARAKDSEASCMNA